MKLLPWLPAAAALALAAAGCGDGGNWVTTSTGLKYLDVSEGEGPAAKPGDWVDLLYTGTLANGRQFESAQDRANPAQYQLGRGQLPVSGLDEGVLGMKVGGKRKLIIPPDLAYKSLGKPPQIPANASLVYVVELVGISAKPKAGRDKSGTIPERPKVVSEEEIKTGKESEGLTEADKGKKLVTLSSGLKYVDQKVGEGTEAGVGDTVEVHYTGMLTDGKKFDSSHDHNEPLRVVIGRSSVIRGWHEGLQGMKKGGQRKLIIPSDLAYGPRGRPPQIPPNATLVFDIEMLKLN
jgi:FKBP-type peptidyl-prolyl cis-trans isomerase